MARIRTLKPEFFRSRSISLCSSDARLTFLGLWCEADDLGHGVADSRVLKGAIWSLEDRISPDDVEAHLNELVATGHIDFYYEDPEIRAESPMIDYGHVKRYFRIVKWENHQSAAYRRGEAKYPLPPARTFLHDEACKELQESAGREVIGKGSIRGASNEARESEVKPRRQRQPDLLFEALATGCGMDWHNLTNAERQRLNRALRDIKPTNPTPDIIITACKRYRKEWPGIEITPTAMANNWTRFTTETAKPTKQASTGPRVMSLEEQQRRNDSVRHLADEDPL